MRLPKSLTVSTIIDAVTRDGYSGFCLACGEEASGVEPDAQRYLCESCGAHMVYGAEEILIRLAP